VCGFAARSRHGIRKDYDCPLRFHSHGEKSNIRSIDISLEGTVINPDSWWLVKDRSGGSREMRRWSLEDRVEAAFVSRVLKEAAFYVSGNGSSIQCFG
jgi:hypothetical protein